MKVLLVKPFVSPLSLTAGDYVELEPLELEYLAAALPDHDVKLIDMRYERDLEGCIQSFEPNVVACTAYSVHVYNTLAIVRAAKRTDPRIFTVVGGHHATLMPHDFQRIEVDAIVCGEGVFSFRELLECLERGLPPGGVRGLWYREDESFAFTGLRNDIDKIDALPLPDRAISSRYRDRYFYLWWKPASLIRASAGCAYRCKFCPIWKAAGGKWMYRSPTRVADELATIREVFVYFGDDNALFDREGMATLCEEIKERAIAKEYFFFARPETVVRCRDLVERWAEIGLRQVFLGLETVEVQRLGTLNKRMDAGTNEEAVAILKANDIDPFAGFMIFPDFSADDFERIYEYMQRLGIYYSEITVLTPAPGSDLYWESKDKLTTEHYELFDYMHPVVPTRLEKQEFFKRLASLYWRSYSPLRALRLRPRTGPPLGPRSVARTLLIALRNYRSIRNAYMASTGSTAMPEVSRPGDTAWQPNTECALRRSGSRSSGAVVLPSGSRRASA